jgi:hypothetical protein
MYLQDSDGKSSGLGLSPASTPESGFRSVLSVENLACSEPEEARATPHYPTRNKTREEFLWVPSSLLYALALLFSVDWLPSHHLTVQRFGTLDKFELSPLSLCTSVSFASLRVNCCWPSSLQSFLAPGPAGPMAIFFSLMTLRSSWTGAI